MSLLVRLRVGEHVVAGTTLAWAWAHSADEPPPDADEFGAAVEATVRVGFERTMEQDAAFGIRQLVDIACKALSPAVNDPYTAVQAVDHLSVIFCALAVRPLGPGRPLGSRAADARSSYRAGPSPTTSRPCAD